MSFRLWLEGHPYADTVSLVLVTIWGHHIHVLLLHEINKLEAQSRKTKGLNHKTQRDCFKSPKELALASEKVCPHISAYAHSQGVWFCVPCLTSHWLSFLLDKFSDSMAQTPETIKTKFSTPLTLKSHSFLKLTNLTHLTFNYHQPICTHRAHLYLM